MINRSFVSCLIASSLAMVACEDKKAPPPAPPKSAAASPIPGMSPQTSKSMGDMAAQAKEKAVAGYQTAVDDAKKQIDELTAKLNTAAEDKKPAMQSALDKAKAQWSDAKDKLATFKSSAAADWQKVSGEVQSSMDSLKKHISDAAAQLK